MVHLVKEGGFVVLNHNRREVQVRAIKASTNGISTSSMRSSSFGVLGMHGAHESGAGGHRTSACFVDEADLEDDFLVCVITKLASGGSKSH